MLNLPKLIKCLSNTPIRLIQLKKLSTSATVVAELKTVETVNAAPDRKPYVKSQSMVAAAFASLQSEDNKNGIKTPVIDDKLNKATTVADLLALSDGHGISRRHALKVVSILADWSNSGKVNLADFEADARFLRLCRILTKGAKTGKYPASRSEDLSTILSVTADDEAAKLVASITLPQMVKIMSTLTQKKRRSTLLLRALSYNITANCDQLDLKQCGDILYSMSMLNYVDENLLAKITSDISLALKQPVKSSSVIGSIITSLGVLKYKNIEILDELSEWVLNNQSKCRPQDIYGLLMTLAVLNYTPANGERLFQVLVPQLSLVEARKPLVWLNVVWSLVLLNQATSEHVSSVLAKEFVEDVESRKELNLSTKLKFLNIDGAAQYLLKDYNGPRLLETSSSHNVTIGKSKEKSLMVEAVLDSLKNLVRNENCLKANINTGWGFFIDAKCLFDKKCNPLAIDSRNEARPDVTKIAIVVYDYHDMCKGKIEPLGVNTFAIKLLEAENYKVLIVPYTDFQPRDKLIHRVQYLENKLREAVNS